MNTEEYDLAIVGGGVAGLYCGLLANNDCKVALFEGSHRFGGKLETLFMHGFDAEYGAMRFDPIRQPLIGKLIADVGLETLPFPEYASPPAQRCQLIPALDHRERALTTLELHRLTIQRVLERSEQEMMALSEAQLGAIQRNGRFQERCFWEQGLWNVFSQVLSYDALRYIIMEGSFFHFIHENPSAAAWMVTWVKMLQMSPQMRTLRTGMQSLTAVMLDRLRQRGTAVYAAHVLVAAEVWSRDQVLLRFADGSRVAAKHVVLALPAHCLARIAGLPPGIRFLLGSVLEIPLLKCFFVVDEPWWDEDIPHLDMPKLPAREVHYQRLNGRGLVMVYADRPYLNFWSRYLRKGYETRAEIDGNEELAVTFSRLMGIERKRVLSYGIRHWGAEPYGAACHLWKPGIRFWTVWEKLAAFSLDRHAPSNVHVCGEAFSDYQGFIEGALRTARDVMERVGNGH